MTEAKEARKEPAVQFTSCLRLTIQKWDMLADIHLFLILIYLSE